MLATWLANDGVGDAFRQASVIAQQYGDTAYYNVECESELAAQAWRCLRRVEKVTVVPKGTWLARSPEYRASMGCPEALAELGQNWTSPLSLSPEQFRVPLIAAKPLVVQYNTLSHKQRFLETAFDLVHHYSGPERTLIGSEMGDSGSKLVQDLRGQPLEVAVGAIASPYCRTVVGVESWACILGALLGKQVVMEISPRAARVLAPNWQRMFPLMTFRIGSQEP